MLNLALLTFLCSASSLLFELIFASTLSFFTGDLVLWQSVSLACYLAALGAGAFYQSQHTCTWKQLYRLEVGICICGALAVPLIFFLHLIYRIYFSNLGLETQEPIAPLTYFGLSTLPIIVGLGFLSGQELPLLLHLCPERKRARSLMLAMSYFGALSGAVLFAHVFRKLSLLDAGLYTTLFNLAAWVMITAQAWPQWTKMKWVPLALLSAILAIFFHLNPLLEEAVVKNFYFNRPRFSYSTETGLDWQGPVGLSQLNKFLNAQSQVRRVRTAYQTLDYVPDEKNPDLDFTLYLNAHPQFHTKREASYHSMMSELPTQLLGVKIQKALILGGGDGLLARDLLEKVTSLRTLKLVELDAGVLEEARREPLKTLNHSILEDPRLSLEIDDAFVWLYTHRGEAFDAIYADFPFPHSGEGLRLYSVEFYKLAYKSLKPRGFLIADYPPKIWKPGQEDLVAHTFYKAGFARVWKLESTGECFVLASRESVELPLQVPHRVQVSKLVSTEKSFGFQSVLKPRAMLEGETFF